MAETKTGAEGKDGSRKAKAKAKPATPPPPVEDAQAPRAGEHVCNVAFCPIGLALSTVQGAAPDVLEHLLKAAQEFLLAARAAIDNRARDFEGEPADTTLHRIEIS
jgi:hypothetical protein